MDSKLLYSSKAAMGVGPVVKSPTITRVLYIYVPLIGPKWSLSFPTGVCTGLASTAQ